MQKDPMVMVLNNVEDPDDAQEIENLAAMLEEQILIGRAMIELQRYVREGGKLH